MKAGTDHQQQQQPGNFEERTRGQLATAVRGENDDSGGDKIFGDDGVKSVEESGGERRCPQSAAWWAEHARSLHRTNKLNKSVHTIEEDGSGGSMYFNR